MMQEKQTIRIENKPGEFFRVEDFIRSLCEKYRIYDEYFGTITRAMDIIFNKIIEVNKDKHGIIEIEQEYTSKELKYHLKSDDKLVIAFNLTEEKEAIILNKLVSNLEINDVNSISVQFYINSLHQEEWVRRFQLVSKYSHKVRKEV
ncbi:MAG TPA: hypothetical protein VJ939_09440 [Bacteroidales bacterium]|nr:hypothetical protein [Bacteroidales bacterium]